MFLGLTHILINIAHTFGSRDLTGKRGPDELLRTASAEDRCQYDRMRTNKRQLKATARTTIAEIKREMQQPRLAGSVRDDPKKPSRVKPSFGVKEI
jgi:hypothetical protein